MVRVRPGSGHLSFSVYVGHIWAGGAVPRFRTEILLLLSHAATHRVAPFLAVQIVSSRFVVSCYARTCVYVESLPCKCQKCRSGSHCSAGWNRSPGTSVSKQLETADSTCAKCCQDVSTTSYTSHSDVVPGSPRRLLEHATESVAGRARGPVSDNLGFTLRIGVRTEIFGVRAASTAGGRRC